MSAIAELTQIAQRTSASAVEASALATSASQSAANGGAVGARVVSTMDEIGASSKKITGVIQVIDLRGPARADERNTASEFARSSMTSSTSRMGSRQSEPRHPRRRCASRSTSALRGTHPARI